MPCNACPTASGVRLTRCVRHNLFGQPFDAALTLLILWGLLAALRPLIDWAFVDAHWSGHGRDACSGGGACWLFVKARFGQFIYGFYPEAQRWRVDLGMALVALSITVILPVTIESDTLAREDLAFALSVVLLGLLMMVSRRNAVSQVVGFMSLENGLVLAATGARGMPLVVEISVAFSILIAFIVIGIFLFRIRERFDTVDVQVLDRFRGERG